MIHQIYYDFETQRQLIPGFKPYENKECSPLFENHVILDLLNQGAHRKGGYFGVIGPRFKHKLQSWPTATPYNESLLDFIRNQTSDVVNLLKGTPTDTIEYGEYCHPGFKSILFDLLNEIGFELEKRELESAIHCNCFVANEQFWDHYARELLFPICEIINQHPRIYANSRYSRPLPRTLRKRWGRSSYPFHPFILERLPNVFLMKHPDYTVTTW